MKKLIIIKDLESVLHSIDYYTETIERTKKFGSKKSIELKEYLKLLENKKYLNDKTEGHTKSNIACSKRKYLLNIKLIDKTKKELEEELKNTPNHISTLLSELDKEKNKAEEIVEDIDKKAKTWDMKEALLDFEKRNILFSIKMFKEQGVKCIYTNSMNVETWPKHEITYLKETIERTKAAIESYESTIRDINYTLENIDQINENNRTFNNKQYDIFNPRIENATTEKEAKGWRKQLYNNLKDIHGKENLLYIERKKEEKLEEVKEDLIYLNRELNWKLEDLAKKTFKYDHVINNIIFYVKTMYVEYID